MSIKRTYITALLLVLSTQAFASSFELWPQSASMLGDAGAGAAVSTDDPTVVYNNPAATTAFNNQTIIFSSLSQLTNVKYQGTLSASPAINNFNNTGTTQGGKSTFIPTLLYAAPITPKFGFGFSVTSPFEFQNNFTDNAFSRYLVTDLQIKTYDLNTAFGYRLLDNFAIGVGVDAQNLALNYNRTSTNNDVANDANQKNKLSDWAGGYHLGALWDITSSTHLGLSYRSRLLHHATGDSDFAGTSGVTSSRVKSNIDLPPMIIASLRQSITPAWDILGTVTYTEWHALRHLTLQNVSGTSLSNVTLQENFKNTWRFLLGTSYQISQAWKIRAGAGYDESPTTNNTRNIFIPDANQYLIALGLSYAFTNNWKLDLGYTHVFFQHVSINHTQTMGNQTFTSSGNIRSAADYLGLQLTWSIP